MVKQLAIVIAVGALLASPAPAHEPKREMGAHEHGRASLKIAMEGDKVLIELESPGANIVGFEHAAETDEQRAAVAAAKARLAEPLTLFVLPEQAGCTLDEAAVELVTEAHEDEHAEAGDHGHAHAVESEHNEYHATYQLTCADSAALRSIGFAFFEAFPATEQIDVTVTRPEGQSAYRVERSAPRLELAGQG